MPEKISTAAALLLSFATGVFGLLFGAGLVYVVMMSARQTSAEQAQIARFEAFERQQAEKASALQKDVRVLSVQMTDLSNILAGARNDTRGLQGNHLQGEPAEMADSSRQPE